MTFEQICHYQMTYCLLWYIGTSLLHLVHAQTCTLIRQNEKLDINTMLKTKFYVFSENMLSLKSFSL